jgi:hypothetical protein
VGGLAFAGVTGAGKSSILAAVAARLAVDRDQSVCVLRNDLIQNPGLRGPSCPASESGGLASLDRTLAHLESLVAWGQAAGGAGVMILCESWAVNLLAELDVWSPKAFLALDARRAACGIILVHLVFDDGSVEERSVSSTRRSRGLGWGRYLDGLGATPADQAAVFRARRDRIARYVALAAEPKLEVATDRMDWAAHAAGLLAILFTEGRR